MNAQLNQLEDKLERWMQEPTVGHVEREIVVIANLLKEVIENLKAIDARLDRAEVITRGAANTASCLANGIHPD